MYTETILRTFKIKILRLQRITYNNGRSQQFVNVTLGLLILQFMVQLNN